MKKSHKMLKKTLKAVLYHTAETDKINLYTNIEKCRVLQLNKQKNIFPLLILLLLLK